MPLAEPFARRPVAIVCAVQAAALLAMTPFYGPHRDELYFVSAGQHLAWGYPDQPPITPILARISTEIAPHHLVVLRLWSLLAVVLLVVLAADVARLLGGRRDAQVLTASTVAVSVVVMAVGHRLSTATFDTLAWTGVLTVVAHALVEQRPRLWLLAGLVAGIGLENKTAVVFVVIGVLVAVVVDPVARPVLRTPWPWLGGILAALIWLPNLLWQAHHGWPLFTFSGEIAEDNGGLGGRIGFLGDAALSFSPVVFLVWLTGIVQLFRRAEWRRARPLASAFVMVTAIFLVTGAKGYYLAGAIPPMIAAGCVWLVDVRAVRRVVPLGVVLALSALVAMPALVPMVPVRTYTGSFWTAIDDDQPETIGWPEYAAQVRAVVRTLSPEQRRTAVVFTGNYGEAGAMQWYDVGLPVYSGHNGFHEWGPPPADASPVVVVQETSPEPDFTDCNRVATLHNKEGADNEESGAGVWVCAGPRGTWDERWPIVSHDDA